MKSLRILSIIGIVLGGLTTIANAENCDLADLYLIALSIVTLVQVNRKTAPN